MIIFNHKILVVFIWCWCFLSFGVIDHDKQEVCWIFRELAEPVGGLGSITGCNKPFMIYMHVSQRKFSHIGRFSFCHYFVKIKISSWCNAIVQNEVDLHRNIKKTKDFTNFSGNMYTTPQQLREDLIWQMLDNFYRFLYKGYSQHKPLIDKSWNCLPYCNSWILLSNFILHDSSFLPFIL